MNPDEAYNIVQGMVEKELNLHSDFVGVSPIEGILKDRLNRSMCEARELTLFERAILNLRSHTKTNPIKGILIANSVILIISLISLELWQAKRNEAEQQN